MTVSPPSRSAAADARVRETSAFFDAAARDYEASCERSGPQGYALRARQTAALELLAGTPGCILDAGMGPGRLCVELQARGWKVTGVDASPGMVEAARARLPDIADRLRVGRVEALPYADGAFDAAVCTGVLEYVADPEQAIAELARVTRPGGRVLVAAANTEAVYVRWKHFAFYPAVTAAKRLLRSPRPPPLPRPWPADRATLERRLTKAGLSVSEVRGAAFAVLPSPLDELAPRTAVALSQRLEGGRGALARRAATQLIFASERVTPQSGGLDPG